MRFPDLWFQSRYDRDGDFEPESRNVALSHVKDWRCAVDGGAHCGIWTSCLADWFGVVHAFEPMPVNYLYLCENVPAPNAVLHQSALGAGRESVGMEPGPEADPNRNSGQWHVSRDGDIEVIPLDSLGLDSLGLLKLDVEGFEYFALKGAEETIKRCAPVIVIEENGLCERYGVKPGQCFDLLESWGYGRVGQCRKDHIFTSQ